jgi:hypothetical protein
MRHLADLTLTLSWGTLNPSDLLPCLLNYLAALDSDAAAALTSPPNGHAAVPAYALEDPDSEWYHSEDAASLLLEIQDLIQERLPQGFELTVLDGDSSHLVIQPQEVQYPWYDVLGEFCLPLECCDDCSRPGMDAKEPVQFWMSRDEVSDQIESLTLEELQEWSIETVGEADTEGRTLEELQERALWCLCCQAMDVLEDAWEDVPK